MQRKLQMTASDSTTHFVYRIVCFTTGKCYVGQTNDIRARRKNHFHLLSRGSHGNDHLQSAWNKYGKDSFYFEVLQQGIEKTLIDEREIYWIEHFDSFNNGFNKTPGGDTSEYIKKSCVWNGVEYDSVKQAAEMSGIPYYSMGYRIRRGYKGNLDISPTGFHAVCWNGVMYKSLTSASKSIGESVHNIKRWMSKGYTCDADLPCPQTFEWNGIKYNSLKEASLSLEVSIGTISHRIKKGYKCDMDIEKAKAGGSISIRNKCIWNNIEYSSQTAAAVANGFSGTTMTKYIQNGWQSDEDVTTRGQKCTWNGIEYVSVTDAANANGISVFAMSRRIEMGYICDQDLRPYRQKCLWNGVVYSSITEAANANGVSMTTMRRKLKALS